MFGVPLDGPYYVMCDNQGVVNNKILPQSTLGQKQNLVDYNVVQKVSAVGIMQVGKEDTENNLADLMTNILG